MLRYSYIVCLVYGLRSETANNKTACVRTFRHVSVTTAALEKKVSIKYSKCVSVALVIQHAKRMRRIVLPSAACPALPYFSTLSRQRHDFGKSIIAHKICFKFLYNFCTNNVSF